MCSRAVSTGEWPREGRRVENACFDCFVHIVHNGHMTRVPHRSANAARAALTVTATEAKTRFGPLLETAMRGGSVIITKHDAPKAILLSMAEFEALGGVRPPDLKALSREFDGLLAGLQTPGKRASLKAAFDATPRDLGRLAVANQRRRG